MGIFDDLAAKFGGVDIEALAERAGVDPEQARVIAGSLLAKLGGGQTDPEAAAQETAGETGMSLETVRTMLPHILESLGGGTALGGLAGKLGGLF